METVENPGNYEARSNLVWCATTALNGHIGAGTPPDWTVHMIGHELTGLFGIDHAKPLAVVLPAVWKVRREQKRVKLLQYGERVWEYGRATMTAASISPSTKRKSSSRVSV